MVLESLQIAINPQQLLFCQFIYRVNDSNVLVNFFEPTTLPKVTAERKPCWLYFKAQSLTNT